MEGYVYKDRLYKDLDSLYIENRKNNLVTLKQFKKNVIKNDMQIEDALYLRPISKKEEQKKRLERKIRYIPNIFLSWCLIIIISILMVFMTYKFIVFITDIKDSLYYIKYLEFFITFHFIIFMFYLYEAIRWIDSNFITALIENKCRIGMLEIDILMENLEIENKINEQLSSIKDKTEVKETPGNIQINSKKTYRGRFIKHRKSSNYN